jgi:hypothetical protein
VVYLVLWTVRREGRIVWQRATWGGAEQLETYAAGLPAGRWECVVLKSRRPRRRRRAA